MFIDCNIYNTKESFLNFFKENLDEMYAANYDALIDALVGYDGELIIDVVDIENNEDFMNIVEVFEIIMNENSKIEINLLG